MNLWGMSSPRPYMRHFLIDLACLQVHTLRLFWLWQEGNLTEGVRQNARQVMKE